MLGNTKKKARGDIFVGELTANSNPFIQREVKPDSTLHSVKYGSSRPVAIETGTSHDLQSKDL